MNKLCDGANTRNWLPSTGCLCALAKPKEQPQTMLPLAVSHIHLTSPRLLCTRPGMIRGLIPSPPMKSRYGRVLNYYYEQPSGPPSAGAIIGSGNSSAVPLTPEVLTADGRTEWQIAVVMLLHYRCVQSGRRSIRDPEGHCMYSAPQVPWSDAFGSEWESRLPGLIRCLRKSEVKKRLAVGHLPLQPHVQRRGGRLRAWSSCTQSVIFT